MASKLYLLLFGLKYSLAGELAKLHNDIENDISVRTKNSKCINKVVSKYFPCGSNIKILSSNDDFNYLYMNIMEGNCYNVGYVHCDQWIWTHDGYIVSAINVGDLYETLAKIKKDKLWNPRAKYIVKVEEKVEESEENDLFNTFFGWNIFDVILLKGKNDYIEISTYFPPVEGSCERNVTNVTSFGNCNEFSEVNLFSNKLVNSWRNCSITVVVSEDPPFVIAKTNENFQFLDTIEGLEQYMLSIIGKRRNLNIDYIFMPPHLRYGVVLPNGTHTGSLAYLQNQTADIAAGAFVMIQNRAQVLDLIFGYSYSTFKLYTAAHKEETWENVYKPFRPSSWCMIIVSYMVFTLVIIVVTYLITGNKDFVKIMLRVLGYFYGNVDCNLIRVTQLRKIMIIWIVFALLISSFYNTAFYSILTGNRRTITPNYDKQYISFLTPCITETILTFFQYTYNETLTTDASPSCRYIEDALDKVAESRNLYTIYFEYIYKFSEYKYIDKDGNKKLDTWDYSSNYMLTMYASKGFPLLNLFQQYVNQLFESGLTNKHLDNIYFKSQLLKANPVRRFKPVTLSDFRIHFGLLLFGMVLSAICFVLELNKRQIN